MKLGPQHNLLNNAELPLASASLAHQRIYLFFWRFAGGCLAGSDFAGAFGRCGPPFGLGLAAASTLGRSVLHSGAFNDLGWLDLYITVALLARLSRSAASRSLGCWMMLARQVPYCTTASKSENVRQVSTFCSCLALHQWRLQASSSASGYMAWGLSFSFSQVVQVQLPLYI